MVNKVLPKWLKDRNITEPNPYPVFAACIIEELLEPLYPKALVKEYTTKIIRDYFEDEYWVKNGKLDENAVIDSIQDIKVFANNETTLKGYDNVKCEAEVLKHISCRKQDPLQKAEWEKNGASGKWLKDPNQDPSELYEPDYEKCKL